MRQLIHVGELPPEAEETANFIERMNDLFDLFNCFGYGISQRKKPVNANNASGVLAVRVPSNIGLLIFEIMSFSCTMLL